MNPHPLPTLVPDLLDRALVELDRVHQIELARLLRQAADLVAQCGATPAPSLPSLSLPERAWRARARAACGLDARGAPAEAVEELVRLVDAPVNRWPSPAYLTRAALTLERAARIR